MTDFHSHTLPGIDDGSKNAVQSIEMLRLLYDAGFDSVNMTPHYYPEQHGIDRFCELRAASFERLEEQAAKQGAKGLPELHHGAEVYLSAHLFSNDDDDLQKLTIDGKGRIMLVEMEYTDVLTDFTYKSLEKIVYNAGITPVLAHIERYPFMYDEKTVLKLLDMGCLAQINASSLIPLFRRRKMLKYIRKGYICEIGSDLHAPSGIGDVVRGLTLFSDKDKAILSAVKKRANGEGAVKDFFD